MVNSGTEATMSAVRVARGFNKREKIVKFIGCYHGHSDAFLAAAGSGVLTLSLPDSPGVTRGTTADTLLVEYNDVEALTELFEAKGDQWNVVKSGRASPPSTSRRAKRPCPSATTSAARPRGFSRKARVFTR